jgi:eukaryotic-like serine/threonine-protein kinase
VTVGRALPWQEGVARFRDATNRPGPAGWQLGTYPDGAGDLPVGGISCTRRRRTHGLPARAFRRCTNGGRLRCFHWDWSPILTLSNFSKQHLAMVGRNRGMSRFGAYDMAGNVKEWATNSDADSRRYLLGGAWNEDRPSLRSPNRKRHFRVRRATGFDASSGSRRLRTKPSHQSRHCRSLCAVRP